jgi:DNA-binding NarL/FixJ family response regulator
MFCYNYSGEQFLCAVMSIWNQLLNLLGFRAVSDPRRYFLDSDIHDVLAQLADQENRSAHDIHADLLAAGLAQRDSQNKLLQRWESLSSRERDVTALTCLGYTNRQIAAKLLVSPDTVKGYVRQVLVKFLLHSKDELRMLLKNWDFSDWGPKAQY